jgi:aminoglycoside phosphotransferase family enzyme/predicted kinase
MSDDAERQEEVFALLAGDAPDGGAVRRVDTHAAAVFLGPERVLKVKRAVRFPFLDFSTLDRRRQACEAELDVNRPYAPDIYRRVLPITREADGRLAIDGAGEPVEWAVEMRRFDERLTLDHLAGDGRIDLALADALGRTVAAAHANNPAADVGPWIAAIGNYIDEHETAFGAMPTLFPPAQVAALARASRAAYDRVTPLLAERGRRGLVRRIHGDLHLGNIVLLDGRPVLFDAIEFSPLIGSGDVLYDLAFLLMDLAERGLSAAANTVFNRYLVESARVDDLDALAALPFFLSLRAQIRAKVTAARLAHAADDERAQIETSARAYFDWSRRFIAPAPPVLIATGGLSGTGKSVLAKTLAAELPPAPGAVVFRSDVERKLLFGKPEHEPLTEDAYTPIATARVYATIVDKARRALAAGQSAVIDAVFAKPQERIAVEQSARALGVPLHALFLTAPLDVRIARVGARRGDASDADAAVARSQEDYDLGGMTWTMIDASGSPEETAAKARMVVVIP